MVAIRFGTDGWRAIIGEDFTVENVAFCAQGVANYLKQEGLSDMGLIVGYDTRFNSSGFARVIAEVMAGNDIVTHFATDSTPTPVVTYNILGLKAAGAADLTVTNRGDYTSKKY